MGCVVTKNSDPTALGANKKHVARVHNSYNHSINSTGLPDKQNDQQADQLGNSPSQLSNTAETPLKELATMQSLKVPAKKPDAFPRLKLPPSNTPSMQDFSFKGSLEGSFEKDKEREANLTMQSPVGNNGANNNRAESSKYQIPKGSTPSFARPSSFRMLSPTVSNNHMESVPSNRDVSPFYIETRNDQVSPIISLERKDLKSTFRGIPQIEDKQAVPTAEFFGEKAKPDETNTEITVTEESPYMRRNDVTIQKDLSTQKELPKTAASTTNTTSVIKFKNIHQKFQKILLSDSAGNSGSSSPANFGSPLSNPLSKDLIKDQIISVDNNRHPDASPPKTLNFLDVPSANDSHTKKSLDLQDQTILENSTGGGFSIGTISNLVNMCKDGKKGDFERMFRTNLVDLIKEKETSPVITKKRTNDLKKTTSTTSGNDLRRSSIENRTSTHYLSKSAFSNNLLTMMKDQDTKDQEIQETQETQDNQKDKSSVNVNIINDDVFGDIEGPSPVSQINQQGGNKYFLPPLPWLNHLNSSASKQSDTSAFQEKTIYNFDEGVSRMDWDKYSICEQINNVEVDDRSLSQTHIDTTSLAKIDMNTSAFGTDLLEIKISPEKNLLKSKSVAYGEPKLDDSGLMMAKSTSGQAASKVNTNESVSTLQYLSPQLVPKPKLSSSGLGGKRILNFGRADSQVIETNRVDKSVDDEGQKKINQYILIKEIGRGGFGKVKLGFNAETKQQIAIKISNKKKLKRKLLTRQKSAYNQLASEIAILKKFDHPNIVKLIEVIDDPNNDKLYLIMEFVKRGAVMSKNYWRQESKANGINNPEPDDDTNPPPVKKKMVLSEAKAKKYFRHLVAGLEYLHNHTEIVHRDIKPENLLISQDDVLKISDFGISKIMAQGDDMLDNNAGTKYYLAPEAWEAQSFHGKPCDIWAAGGTLFFFLVGKPPFSGGIDDLKRKIQEEEPNYPDDPELNPKIANLIKGCLMKDPLKRFTIDDILQDPWLTDDGKNPIVPKDLGKVEVTEEEMGKAFTKVRFMAAVMVTAKLKNKLNNSRRNIEKRKNDNEGGNRRQGTKKKLQI